jgi:hypothetical protein
MPARRVLHRVQSNAEIICRLLGLWLQRIHRVVAAFLVKQSGLKRGQAHTGAVTLIQRFGSAANLNIHLHCMVLDGVYRSSEGVPVFHEVRGPTAAELEALLEPDHRAHPDQYPQNLDAHSHHRALAGPVI